LPIDAAQPERSPGPHGINNNGDIVGFDGEASGFLLTANGVYTTIAHDSFGEFTEAWKVSDSGVIIGFTLAILILAP